MGRKRARSLSKACTGINQRNMELKEFIKTAIGDITDAVSELQADLKNGAIVNPSLPHAIANSTVNDPDEGNVNKRISNIDFDVALTVGESGTTEGGGMVGIQILSAKIGGESKSHTENVSRIAFSIPVVLPTDHAKSKQEKFDKYEDELKDSLRNKRHTLNELHAKEKSSI